MCNIYHTHVLINSIERSLPAISFNDFKQAYNEQKQTSYQKANSTECDCFCRLFSFPSIWPVSLLKYLVSVC